MAPDPDWIIEEVSDAAFTHVLSFSDEIAHRREDLVARSVGFLAGLTQVIEVYQEDRERINVTLIPGGLEALDQTYRGWWDQAKNEPPPWAERLKVLSAATQTVLKPLGFKKRGGLFNRETMPGLVQVVELDRLHHLGTERVRVDVGIYLERADELMSPGGRSRPKWISEPHCQIRQPLETKRTNEEDPYPIDVEPERVADYVESVVVPVLERLETIDDLLEASDQGRKAIGWLGNEKRVLASIVADLGRPDEARARLQEAYEDARPRARRTLLDLNQRLGLDPLETGENPILSKADEAFLESWVQSRGRRVAELQGLMDARPAPGRFGFGKRGRPGPQLDGSDESVAALWRWTMVRAPNIDEMITEPAPLPSRHRTWSMDDTDPSEQHFVDLVTAYLGSVILERCPGAEWGLGSSAELTLVESKPVDLPNCVRQAVDWAKQPPTTVPQPNDPRFNQFESCVRRAVEDLGG